ncbi:MAG: TetR family transcriptional regulator [Archangium sp.]|nr:TetR family transcriptional regulator [Archangium sp.]
MKLSAVILTACLLAFPVWAAGSLDALRSGSRGAREQVTALRTEQLKQRNELSALSAQIETLKAASKGKLLPGGELDSALKRSQELSGVLSALAQQVSGREAELENANMALLDGLSSELTRLRAEFDRQTDRGARKGLIDQLRKLRAERDALRATLPAAKLPTLDAVRPSDDPEELLEQADLLRDNEEKLRRELKTLEARIAERRDEVELDRRVQRFMGEESMFDDSDRRLRVQRTVTTPGTAPTAALADPKNNEAAAPPAGTTADTTAGSGGAFNSPGPFGAQSLGGAAPGAPADARGANEGTSINTGLDSSSIRVTNASDARVQVGGARAISGGDDDLEDLEVERLRLQGLAGQLKQKADELQKRASQLK